MSFEAIRMWLCALVQRSRVESEMEKEMLLHIEMAIEASIRRGMSPEEARRRVAIAFGGVERHKEGVRDERFTRGIEELLAEFRFALRTLGKNRWFAVLATLTLAIGIGATAGVYSLANWVLLRPVPGIAAPQELVVVSFEDSPGQPTGFSFETLVRVKASVPAFSKVMGTADVRLQLSGDNVIARSLDGALVGGDYFDVLEVRPARGRFFTRDELAPTSAARVAVISWSLWESQFRSDSAIVGRTVRFNANEFTIVGVAPREFRGIARLGRVDAWFPAGIYGALRHMAMDLTKPQVRALRFMIARMAPGSSLPVAQQQAEAVAAALLRENPKGHSILESHPPRIYRDIGTPLYGRSRTVKTFRLLFAIGSIVLVIACANVANLLLLRGLARRPEFAVRKALGASASQLLRLHSTEGLIIGLVGGAIGVAVTLLVAQIFNGSPFVDGRYPGEQIQIDARVVGFVFLLALATGILFGLIPGIATIRDRSNVALGDAGRRSTGGGGKLRAGLMVIQVSGSVALIAIALLLGRTIEALRRVELGFDPRNLTSLSINADPQGYTPERLRGLRNELLAAIQAQPGVDTVSVSTSGLPQRASHNADIRPAAMVTDKWPFDARMSPVSPGYFASLGIPILAGRDFTSVDEASSTGAPAIINETTARNLFGERNPMGEALVEREYKGTKLYRIVGVVRDARAADVREPQGPVVYVPMVAAPVWQSEMEFLVRSARPTGDVDGMLRRVVASIDPSIPIGPVVSATSIIEDGVRGERVFLNLVALLGSLAIVLAAVGLYGVTAYSVAQRRREIGIRIALGAGVRAVINTVTRQAAVIAVIGVTTGLLAAATLAGALERMLFGVPRLDFVSYAGAAFVFALFATLACIIPARSAALVDPTEALRAE